jgi:hypothetical protein
MSLLEISNLNPAGSDLFAGEESFLTDLQEADSDKIYGGSGNKNKKNTKKNNNNGFPAPFPLPSPVPYPVPYCPPSPCPPSPCPPFHPHH